MPETGAWVADGANPKQWQILTNGYFSRSKTSAWVNDPDGVSPKQYRNTYKNYSITHSWVANSASPPDQYRLTHIDV